MYTFIIPDMNQFVQEEKNYQALPEAFGPYETSDEAVGAAIDWFRCTYSNEPLFQLISFGEHAENIKLLVKNGDEFTLGATINKLN